MKGRQILIIQYTVYTIYIQPYLTCYMIRQPICPYIEIFYDLPLLLILLIHLLKKGYKIAEKYA